MHGYPTPKPTGTHWDPSEPLSQDSGSNLKVISGSSLLWFQVFLRCYFISMCLEQCLSQSSVLYVPVIRIYSQAVTMATTAWQSSTNSVLQLTLTALGSGHIWTLKKKKKSLFGSHSFTTFLSTIWFGRKMQPELHSGRTSTDKHAHGKLLKLTVVKCFCYLSFQVYIKYLFMFLFIVQDPLRASLKSYWGARHSIM